MTLKIANSLELHQPTKSICTTIEPS